MYDFDIANCIMGSPIYVAVHQILCDMTNIISAHVFHVSGSYNFQYFYGKKSYQRVKLASRGILLIAWFISTRHGQKQLNHWGTTLFPSPLTLTVNCLCMSCIYVIYYYMVTQLLYDIAVIVWRSIWMLAVGVIQSFSLLCKWNIMAILCECSNGIVKCIYPS